MYYSNSCISLSFFGDSFSPSKLSHLLLLEPTDSGIKGDKRKSGAYLKECFWKYQLDRTNAHEGLDESLQKLLNIFKDKVTSIKDFCNDDNVKSKCFIVFESKNKEDVGVVFNNEFINFIYDINAVIEVDIYNL